MNYLKRTAGIAHAFVNSPPLGTAGTYADPHPGYPNRGAMAGHGPAGIERRPELRVVAPTVSNIAVMKKEVLVFADAWDSKRLRPPIRVDSYFPFSCFGHTCGSRIRRLRLRSTASAPVSENDDVEDTQEAHKGIATRYHRGAQVHYIGSIEYREACRFGVGFSSWARLGNRSLL